MAPAKQWLEKFETARNILTFPAATFKDYFSKDELFEQKLVQFEIGTISIPTGQLLVRDPLVSMGRGEAPYFVKSPTGEFPLTVCAVVSEDDCDRYAAIKMTFNDNEAVKFEEALVGNENLEGLQDGDFFGFNVDAGLGCIADTKVRDALCDFEDDFYKKNPEGNIYDDHYSKIFAENYKKHPEHQRSAGDWINFQIPGTDYNIAFFQSGFGDGSFPVYFGYDKDGGICSLIVQFIDIELAYSEEDDDE